jgi:hypothetical protein
VRAARGDAPGDRVALGEHVLDREVQVGKHAAVHRDILLEARAPVDRHGRIVKRVVVGVELVDETEVAAVPAPFDPTANDRFVLLG